MSTGTTGFLSIYFLATILCGIYLPSFSTAAEDRCREDLISLNRSIDEAQLREHLERLARFALDEVQKSGQPSSARTGLNEDLEKKLHDLAERSGRSIEPIRKELIAAKQRAFFSGASLGSTSTKNRRLRQELDQIPKKFGPGVDLRINPVFALSFGSDGLSYAVHHGRRSFVVGSATGAEDKILSENYEAKWTTFNRDGSRLASSTFEEPTIHIWNTIRGNIVRTLMSDSLLEEFLFSPDGSLLVGYDYENHLLVWNLAEKSNSPHHLGRGFCIAFSPDGTLAVGEENGIVLWDADQLSRRGRGLPSGKPKILKNAPKKRFSTIAFSPDGKKIAANFAEEIMTWGLAVIDVEGKTKTQKWKVPNLIWSLAFSPDGKQLAGGFRYRDSVQIWSTADGMDAQNLLTKGFTRNLGFSPDGENLYAAGENGLRVWKKVNHEIGK